jgi:hypothetical protein
MLQLFVVSYSSNKPICTVNLSLYIGYKAFGNSKSEWKRNMPSPVPVLNTCINPSGNCMSQLFQKSLTLYFVFKGFVWFPM